MLRIILIGILAIIILGISVILFNYFTWSNERLSELQSGSQIITTDAGPIEYILKGNQGRVRLYFHGSPGGYDAGPDAGDDYRLLIPSRAGYLATPLEIGKTPEEQADAYAALLDVLAIDEPVQVMGVSGGAPYAIAFADRYPHRTSALLLMSPVSRPINSPKIPTILQTDFTSWLMLSALTKFVEKETLIKMLISDSKSVELVLKDEDKTNRILSVLWVQWPVSLRNPGRKNDLEQYARLPLAADKISAPTLIMHGTNDASVPFHDSEQLAEQIPNATLYAIEGGSHMITFTHEEELKNEIKRFLESQ